MFKIPARAWVLALLSAGLQVLVFPHFNLFFLCWIAVVPLLYALLRGRGGEGELLDSEGRSLRPFTLQQGFLIGWLTGIVWYVGTCYWIYPVMHGYGNLAAPVAALITAGYCLIMGMHLGVFGLLVVLMVRRSTAGNRRPLMLAPFFWTALELFRDRIIGVPWQPLGGAQVDNIPLARITEITGVYGMSFAIVLVNCAFAAALLLFSRRRINLLISAVAAAVALQIGVFARPEPLPATRQAVLVQTNIPLLNNPWKRDFYDQTITDLAQLSVKSSPKNSLDQPGLIVWPESPSPFFVADPKFRQWIATIAQSTNSSMIVGSLGTSEILDKQGHPQLLDSALVVDPQGWMVGEYDKIHLVPFGEYVPFESLLFFASKLTREVGDFGRGTERKVFNVSGTRVGVFICYESIFPDEVREFGVNGSQVYVNIVDDLWFGNTGAPFQHLAMARMRAIENHRWLLFSTNSGVTASIDPLGRIVKTVPRDVRTALLAPFSPLSETTFYTRHGDLFAWVCVVISCLALIVPRIKINVRTVLKVTPEVRPT